MHISIKPLSVGISVLFLTACASVPNGPSAMALPGTGKSFDQFRADDGSCRQFATAQMGGQSANQASNDSFVKSAAVGTGLGAAVGAAAGGGRGAGIGAATGLLIGSLVGVDEANYSSSSAQSRYDHAYIQCMYASGHRVPVSGRLLNQQPASATSLAPARSSAPPAASTYPPPPPPGYLKPVTQ